MISKNDFYVGAFYLHAHSIVQILDIIIVDSDMDLIRVKYKIICGMVPDELGNILSAGQDFTSSAKIREAFIDNLNQLDWKKIPKFVVSLKLKQIEKCKL